MLREKIDEAMKQAMVAKQAERLGTVRLIKAKLKDMDINARGSGKEPLSDDEILGMLSSMVKQRKESIESYKQGGRQDLVDKEKAEIEVISEFMPTQMSEAEIKQAIAAVIAETGASSVKDMGKVMGAMKSKYAGRMDFSTASTLIKTALN